MSTDGRSRSGTADTFRYPKKNHQKPWAGAEPLQASLPTGGVLHLLQTEVPCTTWHDVDLNVLRGQAVTRMCLGASRVRWKECLKSTSHLGFSWAYSVHQTHKGVLGILGQDSANQNLMMP